MRRCRGSGRPTAAPCPSVANDVGLPLGADSSSAPGTNDGYGASVNLIPMELISRMAMDKNGHLSSQSITNDSARSPRELGARIN